MACFLVMLLAWLPMPSMAQEVPAHAITNVTIHMADGATLENADIVWRNGVIEQIGVNAPGREKSKHFLSPNMSSEDRSDQLICETS